MNVFITDVQAVPELEGTLFTMLQQGSVTAMISLKNSDSANTINYRFQQYNGTTWADMSTSGTDYYNTLIAGQVKFINLSSAYPQVRLVGNASGGATLDFGVTRYFARTTGGSIPILNL